MLEYEATAAIKATTDDVWSQLIRTDQWSSWDATLESVTGTLSDGGKLVLRVKGVAQPFKLQVTHWAPGKLLVLTGGMPFGLFTGTRRYELTNTEAGCQFRMHEQFTGFLAGMIGKSIPNLQPAFDNFAAGLRAAAETQ